MCLSVRIALTPPLCAGDAKEDISVSGTASCGFESHPLRIAGPLIYKDSRVLLLRFTLILPLLLPLLERIRAVKNGKVDIPESTCYDLRLLQYC